MDFGWLDIRCCINYGFAYLLLGVSLAQRARTKGYISFVNNMTDFPNNFFGSNFHLSFRFYEGQLPSFCNLLSLLCITSSSRGLHGTTQHYLARSCVFSLGAVIKSFLLIKNILDYNPIYTTMYNDASARKCVLKKSSL